MLDLDLDEVVQGTRWGEGRFFGACLSSVCVKSGTGKGRPGQFGPGQGKSDARREVGASLIRSTSMFPNQIKGVVDVALCNTGTSTLPCRVYNIPRPIYHSAGTVPYPPSCFFAFINLLFQYPVLDIFRTDSCDWLRANAIRKKRNSKNQEK